jgi:hypothetical protein
MGEAIVPAADVQQGEWMSLRESLSRIQDATSHLVNLYSSEADDVCNSTQAAASASMAATLTLGLALALALVLLLQTLMAARKNSVARSATAAAAETGTAAPGGGGGGSGRGLIGRLPGIASGLIIGLLANRGRTPPVFEAREVSHVRSWTPALALAHTPEQRWPPTFRLPAKTVTTEFKHRGARQFLTA